METKMKAKAKSRTSQATNTKASSTKSRKSSSTHSHEDPNYFVMEIVFVNEEQQAEDDAGDGTYDSSVTTIQNFTYLGELTYDTRIEKEYKQYLPSTYIEGGIDHALLARLPKLGLGRVPLNSNAYRTKRVAPMTAKLAKSDVSHTEIVSERTPPKATTQSRTTSAPSHASKKVTFAISPAEASVEDEEDDEEEDEDDVGDRRDKRDSQEEDTEQDTEVYTKYLKGDTLYWIDYDKSIVYDASYQCVGEIGELGEVILYDGEPDAETEAEDDEDERGDLEEDYMPSSSANRWFSSEASF